MIQTLQTMLGETREVRWVVIVNVVKSSLLDQVRERLMHN